MVRTSDGFEARLLRPLTKPESSLLRQWYNAIFVRKQSHEKTSQVFRRWERMLRILRVILPAFASVCGTHDSLVESAMSRVVLVANHDLHNQTWTNNFHLHLRAEDFSGRHLAMLLMVLNATIIAIDGRLHYAERSEAHHTATKRFGSIEGQIETMFNRDKVMNPKDSILTVRKMYSEAVASCPVVPFWVYRWVSRYGEVKELKELGVAFEEKAQGVADAKFSQAELDMLLLRAAMTRTNRLHFVSHASSKQWQGLYFGSIMGAMAVIATMLGALAFADIPQAEIYQIAARVGNGCLSLLAIADGTGGYDEMAKKMFDLSSRWSDLNRELEEALYTQPHHRAGAFALSLKDKVQAFVDELQEQKLGEHVRQKEHPDVKKELEKVTKAYWDAQEGYEAPMFESPV